MFELIRSCILAVPYRKRRALKVISLPDGAIVERATADQIRQVPNAIPAYFEIPGEDRFVGHIGNFMLATGDVAVVYGAKAVPIE